MSESKVISKETIHRLLGDIKYVFKNPLTDNGIYYCHDEEDIMKGYAMIVGPESTPYFGGYYFFELVFPTDYPFSPPKVKYMTNDGHTRFNPNLYKCGKVCVSVLNTWSGDKWSACQTINSILLTLCSLLNETPLLNEPGQHKTSKDYNPYNKSIEYTNIDFAICELIDPSKNKIPEQFLSFYPFMKERFYANYDKLVDFINSKTGLNEYYNVQIYQMETHVKYDMLKEKMEVLFDRLKK
jgi:ubiquitin-protein ligase